MLVLTLTDITCCISLLHLLPGFLENSLHVPNLRQRLGSFPQGTLALLFAIYPVSHLLFPLFPFRKLPRYRATLPPVRSHFNTKANSIKLGCSILLGTEKKPLHAEVILHALLNTWDLLTCALQNVVPCRDPSSSSSVSQSLDHDKTAFVRYLRCPVFTQVYS